MPYTVNAGAVMEVTVYFTVENQLNMSVFHYIFSSGSAILDGKQACLDMIAAIEVAGELVPRYLDCLTDQILDVRVKAQWITPTRYRYVPSPTPPAAGTVVSGTMPSNVAVAITKYAEVANRHGIGTLHMGGVPVLHVDESFVSVAGTIAYDALADRIPDIHVLPTGQSMVPVLFNRANPIASETIIDAVPQTTMRVERRRTVGLGV